MNYSEVRTGGYEDTSTAFATSGEAFANSLRTTLDIADRVTGDAELYVWGDMIDPNHNARDNYYEVAGDLDGAIDAVDADRVTVINWWERGEPERHDPRDRRHPRPRIGRRTLRRVLRRQRLHADHRRLLRRPTSERISTPGRRRSRADPTSSGSVYATWVDPPDFTQIGAFGELWWTTGPALPNDRIDEPASGTFATASRIVRAT